MDQVDEQTRQRIREWQLRRLEIKNEMAAHPEKVLELTKVLDQMEEEHERILSEASLASDAPSDKPEGALLDGLDFQLRVSASNARDLRKLLEMALHELDGLLEADARQVPVDGRGRVYPGGMSGSLGAYEYALEVAGDPETSKS
ncbi:hypothetical protein NJF44_18995 [Pseudomonas guariconensis]|uniref:hypothetical protein n=1 Tax=Pseudomonas TaxID=286 RepID=UPI002096E258|nr:MULTISPECIES: hypothetical protein [Pseudomonas]MCO7516876.1 hypothetical protein [Pseudomonas putida]MCO7594873.1 hypothetical protein [Pseudomonas guariconensis]MCO7607319.1 hypothetical protein [Pseudomonas guariconensis]MCU7222392.1 hypothetical protein [Pseudomonas brassicacearum]